MAKPSSISIDFETRVNPKVIQRKARYSCIDTTLRYDQTADKMVKDYYNKTQEKINNETNNRGDNNSYA